jgi:HPt (histidine-containing phosphotransfer) domain-containing protein
MNRAKPKLSSVLGELKNDYLKKLPQKIDNLKVLAKDQNWEALEDEYHKLKGTGKTYGFPEISVLCEKLELLSQLEAHRSCELFESAHELLERMHQGYLKQEPLKLDQDSVARSLLALKPK